MSTSILNVLIEVTLRGTTLIAATYGVSVLLRRAPAAVLHWVWLLTLSAILIMPVWVWAGPDWSMLVPVRSASETNGVSDVSPRYFSIPVQPVVTEPLHPDNPPSAAQDPQIDTAPTGPLSPSATTAAQPSRRTWLDRVAFGPVEGALLLWLTGVVLCLGHWSREQVGIVRLARRGGRCTDQTWLSVTRDTAATLNLKRQITLITSGEIVIPMTWGFLRPVVFLPADAPLWMAQRRQVTLTHELMHVKRGDTLTQWIGLLACALNWFNPLVWLAFRRMAVECERACDDRVLALGTSGPDYAGHLVALARSALHLPTSIRAFSRKSELSVRVHSILNPTRSRRSMTWRHGLTVMFGYLSLVTLPLSIVTPALKLPQFTASRQAETTLLLALPGYLANSITTDVLDDFEASHPGLRVVLNPVDEAFTAPRYSEEYYAQLERYASAGDVLFVQPPQFGPAATLPGYFLDLTPLASADADLDDFFPAALQSFQWDGRQWALPTTWNLAALWYDPAGFDAAGLTYPSPDWTLDDLVNMLSADNSSLVDAVNNVLHARVTSNPLLPDDSQFNGFDFLLASNVLDDLASDGVPAFGSSDLAAQVELWAKVVQEQPSGKHLQQPEVAAGAEKRSGVALIITPLNSWKYFISPAPLPLPGGHVPIIDLSGVAVSAGTQHPEAAYELAKFLTTRAESLNVYGDSVAPARRSLFDSPANHFPADFQPTFKALAAQAVPLSALRYQNYLGSALRNVIDNGVSGQEALNQAQDQALADYNAALARQGTFTLSIPVPAPIEVADGKIVLRFGLQSSIQPLPNLDWWQRVQADFSASDPDVGYVDLAVFDAAVDDTDPFDCFYTPLDLSTLDTSMLLPLDPLMATDPAFDAGDFPPGVLDRVRLGSDIFGYPLTIQPQVLAYNRTLLDSLGIPLLTNDWTTSEFEEALRSVTTATGHAALDSPFGTQEHLFILIEFYGGRLIDTSTTPPTARFTTPENVEAVRHALGLVAEGLVNYRPIHGTGGPVNGTPDTSALLTAYLDPFSTGGVSTGDGWDYVFYPIGRDITPVSIGVGAAYISRQAANPEACYRWIATLGAHPELTAAMPARTSAIDALVLSATQGDSTVAVYRQISTLMRAPNAYVIGASVAGEPVEISTLKYWLEDAFDVFLVQQLDLGDALAEAQIKADGYLGCLAQIPEGLAAQDTNAYRAAQNDCARQVDPGYFD
ncbi:extracellular solute-binding protein [Aggregatilinea lenta]|uniref:extracellular solute-binding protein n=1 Tax=Aggregatilinea lenta TaxID=913108 RepID=UPI0013C2D9E8|nr:extracellular solute-binding protein [Aggregatilinea lenta]